MVCSDNLPLYQKVSNIPLTNTGLGVITVCKTVAHNGCSAPADYLSPQGYGACVQGCVRRSLLSSASKVAWVRGCVRRSLSLSKGACVQECVRASLSLCLQGCVRTEVRAS